MDHEMIAAGHPDLYFELDSFSAVMPRHWKTPRESSPGVAAENDAWYGVREWGTGQAVQLRASMERIAWRAKGKSWPEYSELQCFACHHSLTAARTELAAGTRLPWTPSGRSAVERFALRRFPRSRASSGWRDLASRLDDQVTQLGKSLSQLNPDRGCCGSGVGQRRCSFESARHAHRSAALRCGDDIASHAEDFRRCRGNFERRRAGRRTGGYGARFTVHRVFTGGKGGECRGNSRGNQRPFPAA